MARRNSSSAEILVQLPWQISAVLAVVAFVGLRWVLPAIGSESKVLDVFIKVGAQNAWIAAVVLGIISIFSAIHSAKKRALLDSQRDIESLRALSWKEFEWLVGEAYRRQGYTVEEQLGGGADGGIDVGLSKGGQTWLVQCKRWKTQSLGAPVVREMFGLLTHHKATGVIVVCSGHFTREAISFAEGKPIELVDGPALLNLVQSVQRAPASATASTPPPQTDPAKRSPVILESPHPVLEVLCPSCGASMVKRTAKKGANAGNTFWGCSSYPTCRGVRNA